MYLTVDSIINGFFLSLRPFDPKTTKQVWNNFQHYLDPFCNQGLHIEITIHFFLHCSDYSSQRKPISLKISNIKSSLLNENGSTVVETFLFGSNGLSDKKNQLIIESTVEYIITTGRFVASFLWIYLTKLSLLVKPLIDCRSPYFIFASCLVVQKFYIVFLYIVERLLLRLCCM